MPWLQIVVSMIFAGFLLFLINSYIPLERSVKSVLNAVVIIVIVVWLINTFGIVESIRHFRVGLSDEVVALGRDVQETYFKVSSLPTCRKTDAGQFREASSCIDVPRLDPNIPGKFESGEGLSP